MVVTQKKKSGFPAWLKWMLILSFALTTFFVSTVLYVVVDKGLLYRPINPAHREPDVQYQEPDSKNSVAMLPALRTPIPTPTISPLNSDERLTVLMMGLDRRTGEEFVSRTDTMILFSIVPKTGVASILSIPRDLYVDIPNYDRQDRINTAFVLGAIEDGEAAGAELAMATIEENLGIHVDHYALLDFDTVIQLVDAVGGVTVNVPVTIDDPLYPDMNYGYDPLYIEAGTQKMAGELALKYMRTRHIDDDFGRANRQQQVIMAFREQFLGLGIGGMASTLPTLFSQVRNGIFTDLSLNDLLSISQVAKDISADNINSVVLDYNYVESYTTDAGAQVLLIRQDAVAQLVAKLFD